MSQFTPLESNGCFDLACCANWHGALGNDNNISVDVAANGVRNLQDILEVGAAVFIGRCAHGNEHDVHVIEFLLETRAETQSARFGVLVDESGSMGWSDHGASKAEKARKATILLEDTLRKLDVPFMIVGHTTKGYGVALKSYVDFDTNDGKDCYRLAGITGHNNNIDGAAISYVGEKLLKRPEEVKVMIVISDGRPCGGSYYSENADTDTTLAIKHYRKKGVNVFGAIVDSFSSVSTLYGEEFCFDCSEGRELERQLCRLVKRYLVK